MSPPPAATPDSVLEAVPAALLFQSSPITAHSSEVDSQYVFSTHKCSAICETGMMPSEALTPPLHLPHLNLQGPDTQAFLSLHFHFNSSFGGKGIYNRTLVTEQFLQRIPLDWKKAIFIEALSKIWSLYYIPSSMPNLRWLSQQRLQSCEYRPLVPERNRKSQLEPSHFIGWRAIHKTQEKRGAIFGTEYENC